MVYVAQSWEIYDRKRFDFTFFNQINPKENLLCQLHRHNPTVRGFVFFRKEAHLEHLWIQHIEEYRNFLPRHFLDRTACYIFHKKPQQWERKIPNLPSAIKIRCPKEEVRPSNKPLYCNHNY